MNVAALPEHAPKGTPAGHAVLAADGTPVAPDFAGLVAALFDTADASSGLGAEPKPVPGDSRSPSPDPSLEALAAAAAGIAVPSVVPSTAGTTATAASVAAPEARTPAPIAGCTRTASSATANPTAVATAASPAAPTEEVVGPDVPTARATDGHTASPEPPRSTVPAATHAEPSAPAAKPGDPAAATPCDAAAATVDVPPSAATIRVPERRAEDGVHAVAAAKEGHAAVAPDAKAVAATRAGEDAGQQASGERRELRDVADASPRQGPEPHAVPSRERTEPATSLADAPASPRAAAAHGEAAPSTPDAPPPVAPAAAVRDAHGATHVADRSPHDAPAAAPPPHDVERLLRVDEMRPVPLREDGEMRLQVSPEGLGPIEVRVAVRDDAVHASLVAAHDHAREALEAHRGSLEAALGRSNLRLEGFSVGLGQERQDQGFGQAPRRDEVPAAPAAATSAPAAVDPTAIERAAARGLSLRA